MTPLKSIRKYCLSCCNNSIREVQLCTVTDCELYSYRLGKGKPKLKNIKKQCLDCSTYSNKEIKECSFTDCPLFGYRFGRNPKLKGKGGNFALFGKKARPTSRLRDKQS